MSKFTKEKIDEYANKLLIGLTEEENEMVLKEFNVIEDNMNFLSTIPNLTSKEPMTHALDDFHFSLTEDNPEESLDIADALQNCGDFEDREVKVPRVVG